VSDTTVRPPLRRIARLFRPYRGRLLAVLALIAVSAGLGMVSPFLLREVLDVAIPERDTTLLAGSSPA
jgi:ATP-binding cassette subfamily B protein